MGKTVSIDADRLREGASTLAAGAKDPQSIVLDRSAFGSASAGAAFDEFSQYWSSGRSVLSSGTDALAGVLRSAADAYARRDVEDARQFSGGARAF
ncbi:hypothetical protein GCM10027406_09490 [Leifsonia lichenia]